MSLESHIADRIDRNDWRDGEEARLRRIARDNEIVDDSFDPLARTSKGYIAPGPVGLKFILAYGGTDVIMGPLGGGKTTACVFKRIKTAALAPLAWADDGVATRMCRAIVLRDTYRNVEKSVLSSWELWFHRKYPGSSWKGGNDRPATHTLMFRGQDGVRIECVTEFAGLNEHDIETMMKGTEYSVAWLNELDTHAEGSLADAESRVGRWPPADRLLSRREVQQLSEKLGRPIVSSQEQPRTVIGDMNAPTKDNWTFDELILNPKPGRRFFQQPSGLSAQAENRLNLPKDYYTDMAAKQDQAFVRRMIENEFGESRQGKPVHPSFSRDRHVARTSIVVDPRRQLGIGIDISTNALTPAAVFGQNDTRRINLVGELWPGHGYGPVRFAERLAETLNERFQNCGSVTAWADPASAYGGDLEGGQLAAMEVLQQRLKIPILIPFGGSNELSLRLETVNMELRGYLEPDSWLLISPDCPMLIEAFGNRYRFRKLGPSAPNDFDDKPEKSHPWSDLMDAGQYLIGGMRGRQAIIGAAASRNGERPRTQDRPPARRGPKGGFDPRTVGLPRR